MNLRAFSRLAPVLGLLAASPSLFAAPLPAFSFSSANFATYDNASGELGYDFTTGNYPVQVTALGYIDDGFNATHSVALFEVATQQAPGALVSVTTSGGGSSSTSFSYTALSTPVLLAANTEYQIVSQFFDNEHYFIQAQGLVSQAGLTIGNPVYDYYAGGPPFTPAFAHGVSTVNYPGDFGPNLLVAAVPEPGSLALSIGGLLILGVALTAWPTAPAHS